METAKNVQARFAGPRSHIGSMEMIMQYTKPEPSCTAGHCGTANGEKWLSNIPSLILLSPS